MCDTSGQRLLTNALNGNKWCKRSTKLASCLTGSVLSTYCQIYVQQEKPANVNEPNDDKCTGDKVGQTAPQKDPNNHEEKIQ